MDSIPSSISVKEVDAGAAQSTVIRSASHEPPPHTPTIYHAMQQTSAALPILQPCVLTSDVAPPDLIGACNVKKIESTRTPQSKAWPRMLPEDRSISEVQDLNLQTLLSSSAPQDSHPTYRLHPVPLIFTNAEYPKIRDRIEQEIATQTSSLRNGGSYSFSLPSLDEVNDFYLKNPHLDEEHVLESKYVSELEIPERMIVRLQMLQFPFVRDILECETPHAELDSCLQHAANINLQTGDYANRVRQEINSLREKVRAQHVEILETTRGIIRLEQDVSRRNEGITENSANRATRDDKSVLESLVKQMEKGGSINGVLRRRVKERARKLDRQSEDMLRNLETSKQYSCAGPSHLEQRHMKAGDGFDGSTSFKEDKGDGNPPCGPTNPMASTLGSIRAYLDLRRKVHILALLEHLTLS